MLVTAIWMSALALMLAGGALALAAAALVRDGGKAPAPVQETAVEEQEELLRRGMANLMGYDPQECREGEV